ncbi:ABC transporter ATP-binding protein [Microbacterium sp.]|uniref:ABC transporter ATP-binding protein n=1 Tax=Microbacterium sp. TaxID=51671 RepID=UPI003C7073BD
MSDKETLPALSLLGLRKSYRGTTVVDDVRLAVAQGSLTGVVGPNGAGKTTTLSMAVGLLRPDAGTSLVRGIDLWRRPAEAKRLLGVLPAGLALPERLTGTELLTYWGLLRGIDLHEVRRRAEELLSVLDLDGAEDRVRLVLEYSTGMRKKIGLATALLHNPRVLVLDEPFEAVDPVSARTIRRILRQFVQRGGAVLISSHVMPLVEQLCDQVALIADGRVLAAGPIDEVRDGLSLEDRFVTYVGERPAVDGEMSWLGT